MTTVLTVVTEPTQFELELTELELTLSMETPSNSLNWNYTLTP